jgi:hypothetical protein
MEEVSVKSAKIFAGIGVLFLWKFPEYVLKQRGNEILLRFELAGMSFIIKQVDRL